MIGLDLSAGETLLVYPPYFWVWAVVGLLGAAEVSVCVVMEGLAANIPDPYPMVQNINFFILSISIL